ncbi:hypothetical protein NDU88_010203 [Pleurodeles waltl]|uniref:Secreted protein n=1 Tax=Pleurodeles waltl TaxID=8319 RepID=A0AAV7S0K4_PLEWA|nr:hypothetical protein NDU88_010203 [Pleurodeles waltl]
MVYIREVLHTMLFIAVSGVGRWKRVVTAPAVPEACSVDSLPLRVRRSRSSEDATPPLLPGLLGLGRVTGFLPYAQLLRGPSRIVAARSTRSKRPSCFVARPRPRVCATLIEMI